MMSVRGAGRPGADYIGFFADTTKGDALADQGKVDILD